MNKKGRVEWDMIIWIIIALVALVVGIALIVSGGKNIGQWVGQIFG